MGNILHNLLSTSMISALTIVVRDQDHLPLRGMGISISNDESVSQKLTDILGRVNFDLCYGDDVIIQVYGASFETRSCRLEIDSLKFKVGSTNFLNFDAACHFGNLFLIIHYPALHNVNVFACLQKNVQH